MRIRFAKTDELKEINTIYDSARAFMSEHGNPTQWARRGHPSPAFIASHIGKDL